MKKLLLSLLFANLLPAQNQELLNIDWKITKIVTELIPEKFPPNAPVVNVTRFSVTEPNYSSTFFNSAAGNLTYNGNDIFTINSRGCTLADYMDDDGQVNNFFKSICDFYGGVGQIYYHIQNNGTEKTLVLSNSIFEEIHFSAINLGVKNDSKSSITFAPNPVEKSLKITHQSTIKTVSIFDLSGKLVREERNINTKSMNIDLQNLKAGIYLVKINNEEPFKIIKK